MKKKKSRFMKAVSVFMVVCFVLFFVAFIPANRFHVVKFVAEKGYARAQYTLGQMYEKGQGVGRDLQEAEKWYQQAAAKGHAEAKTALDAMKR